MLGARLFSADGTLMTARDFMQVLDGDKGGGIFAEDKLFEIGELQTLGDDIEDFPLCCPKSLRGHT